MGKTRRTTAKSDKGVFHLRTYSEIFPTNVNRSNQPLEVIVRKK